jgi:hypothetical protein
MMNNYSKAKDELIYQGHLWAYNKIKEIGATHALTLAFSAPFTDTTRDEKDREQCRKILKYGMNNISKKIYGSHNKGVIQRFITIERGAYNKSFRLHAHAVITNDTELSDEQFVECVFNGWAKTKGAHESTSMFSINKLYDIAGWSTYINKTMGGRYDFDEVNYTHNTKELAKT